MEVRVAVTSALCVKDDPGLVTEAGRGGRGKSLFRVLHALSHLTVCVQRSVMLCATSLSKTIRGRSVTTLETTVG